MPVKKRVEKSERPAKCLKCEEKPQPFSRYCKTHAPEQISGLPREMWNERKLTFREKKEMSRVPRIKLNSLLDLKPMLANHRHPNWKGLMNDCDCDDCLSRIVIGGE